jgi:hypothetical protein
MNNKIFVVKYATIAKCSKDTAIRDINDLIDKNILQKESAGGRSTNYELKNRKNAGFMLFIYNKISLIFTSTS